MKKLLSILLIITICVVSTTSMSLAAPNDMERLGERMNSKTTKITTTFKKDVQNAKNAVSKLISQIKFGIAKKKVADGAKGVVGDMNKSANSKETHNNITNGWD